MKKALVCGAGGFIGGHLVKKLKDEGYWVRGVDIKAHEFRATHAKTFPTGNRVGMNLNRCLPAIALSGVEGRRWASA